MTLHRTVFLLCLLCYVIDFALAVCPSGCICANTVVECKCSSLAESSMTLGSFRHIDFVSKLYIHSCRNLTIPAEAFSGLALSHELSISSIHTLHIHPFAFRDLIKYPERLTIATCNIPLLPPNAFVGFHRVAHMWFRNVNVSRIADGAFRHVSDIEYVYFRESNLGHIDSNAFSNMTNISHFFIRGRTKIDRIEPSAFQYSLFKKIIFEEAKVRSISAYAFNGPLRYDSTLFENVVIENVDFSQGTSKVEKLSSARKLEFLRCRFERRLPLSPFCSNVLEVKFEDSHIGRLVPLPASNLQNVTNLRIIRSTINSVESRALYGASNIGTIIFEDSIIRAVGEKAVGAVAGVERLDFLRCSINRLSGSAFDNAVIDRMRINGCSIEVIKAGSLGNAEIGQLRFAYSEIKTMEAGAFSRLRADYLGFEYTRINEIKEYAFAGIRARIFNISNCDLRPRINETWLTAAAFHRLSMNTNKFSCSCGSRLGSQLAELRQRKEVTMSNFLSLNNNFCIDEVTNVTLMLEDYFPTFCRRMNLELGEHFETSSGLRCSRSFFLVSCACNAYDADTVIDARVTTKLSILINATTLLFSRCRRLRVARNAIVHFSLSHFIISDCESVELETDFWWQKSAPALSLVRISHVGQLVLHRNTFSFSQPSPFSEPTGQTSVEFINCTIGKVSTDAFENARIGELTFIGSRIGVFAALFARKSRIDDFSIENCRVGRLSQWAFNDTIIDKFRIEKSRVHEVQGHSIPERLTKRAFVCFVENQLACRCDLAGMDVLVNANGCDGGSNTCFDTDGAPDEGNGDDLLAANIEGRWAYHCHEGVAGVQGDAYDLPQRDTAELVRSASATSPESVTAQTFIAFTVQLLIALGFA